jgi:hypothetical protein
MNERPVELGQRVTRSAMRTRRAANAIVCAFAGHCLRLPTDVREADSAMPAGDVPHSASASTNPGFPFD